MINRHVDVRKPQGKSGEVTPIDTLVTTVTTGQPAVLSGWTVDYVDFRGFDC